MSIAEQILSAVRGGSEGGTFPLASESLPDTGFYVGGVISSLILVPGDTSATEELADTEVFVAELQRLGVGYVGHWTDEDDGRVYIDGVEHHTTEFAAASVARERHEISIWDIANNRELRLAYVDGE